MTGDWPRHYPAAVRFMGLDLGDATIGVAVSDPLGIAAHAVETIRRRGHEHDFARLADLVADREVSRIVLGLPLNMDDTEGERARKTRAWAEEARSRLGLPVVLWDERLSTWEAEGLLKEMGVPPKKRKALVDQVAAEIILRAYLEAGAPEHGR